MITERLRCISMKKKNFVTLVMSTIGGILFALGGILEAFWQSARWSQHSGGSGLRRPGGISSRTSGTGLRGSAGGSPAAPRYAITAEASFSGFQRPCRQWRTLPRLLSVQSPDTGRSILCHRFRTAGGRKRRLLFSL